MKFVSPLLKRVVYPCLAGTGYLRGRANGGDLCVVTYHGVLPAGYKVTDPDQDGGLVKAEQFRRQLRLLKSRYHVVSPKEVLAWAVEAHELPDRSVLLTCDDGLLNTLTDMAPVLREENLSCLFFVLGPSTGQSSQRLWYEDLYLLLLAAPAGSFSFESLGVTVELKGRGQRRQVWGSLLKKLSQFDQPERERFIETARARFGLSKEWDAGFRSSEARRRRFSLLNLNELRQLVDQGMYVGSHTLNHPMLSQQSSELAWKEISESRSALENVLGARVWALAYPFGDVASVTSREWQMAEQAGFECAFMNVGGGFGAALPRFALPRVHVTSEMSLAEFEAHVSGFHNALRARLSGEAQIDRS
jgi:peptidoglycan/xylan/chitin deacetylase (PgdA/CDA1 family)